MSRSRSSEPDPAGLWERAVAVLPGGVDSPARAFSAVGGIPPVAVSGRGATITAADGREYRDFMLGYGCHILGHGSPAVKKALSACASSFTFGMTIPEEIELAERLVEIFPSAGMARFVNSGTEATMSAIRLARGITGRRYIVKCDGGYHGHSDALLARAGSGVATLGLPDTGGVTELAVSETIVIPYNDIDAASAAFAAMGEDIAALIVEPVAGNMGCVPPKEGYLAQLRTLTALSGSLLIFDEVMTGFRVAFGGAQFRYDVVPDLTCLGKIIGGGFPVGAILGSREHMEHFAPVGSVYQAGTLSGHRAAMVAGLSVLDTLERGDAYSRFETLSSRLSRGVEEMAATGVPVRFQGAGGMFTIFFTGTAVENFDDAKKCDSDLFARFHRSLMEEGILFPPSQFESVFLSTRTTTNDIDRVLAVLASINAH